MASDGDDDVRRAIQLSLEEAEAGAQRGGRAQAIDLTEDDDDDDDDGVWDGFDNVDEMDYWKAIVLSMGLGT